MQVIEQDGAIQLRWTSNPSSVTYEYTDGIFRGFGHRFESSIENDGEESLNFYRAQLAFRGFSPRGSKLEVLQARLQSANTCEMDLKVRAIRMLMRQEWQKRMKWANREIDMRLAKNDPERFLRDIFYDENGMDEGGPPIVLDGLDAGYRQGLHAAAGNLFHETSVTGRMVIGSSKNKLGEEMLRSIDRTAGWPPEPYEPQLNGSRKRKRGDEDRWDGDNDDEDDGSDGSGSEKGHDPNAAWDITGTWELECPGMASMFGQFNPYTMTIFRKDSRNGSELFGRFDLGEYRGVFRFSSQIPPVREYVPQAWADMDQYILKASDMPSSHNPTIHYRWRGKERGEDVIQLRSDRSLYEMKFSDSGRKVKGVWDNHDAEPGRVGFTGVKVGANGPHDSLNIKQQWNQHSEDAYERARKARWRRRY